MNKSDKNVLSEFLADRYRLMAFIRAMVRDNHVAEDIFQEVWMRLDNTIRREVEIVNTASFCRGIAKNLILHHFRDQKRTQAAVDPELLNLVEVAFEEQDAAQHYFRARENALRDCIQKLPEHAIEVLSLKYESGLPIAKVATRLNKTIFAVTKLLSRLRQKLRDCVTETLQTEGIYS